MGQSYDTVTFKDNSQVTLNNPDGYYLDVINKPVTRSPFGNLEQMFQDRVTGNYDEYHRVVQNNNPVSNKYLRIGGIPTGIGGGLLGNGEEPYISINPDNDNRTNGRYASRILPGVWGTRDAERLAKFSLSIRGLAWRGYQQNLQSQNAFNETQIFNPLFLEDVAARSASNNLLARPTRTFPPSGGLTGLITSAVNDITGAGGISVPSGTVGATSDENPSDVKGLLRIGTALQGKGNFDKKWNDTGVGGDGGALGGFFSGVVNKIKSAIPFGGVVDLIGGSGQSPSWKYRPDEDGYNNMVAKFRNTHNEYAKSNVWHQFDGESESNLKTVNLESNIEGNSSNRLSTTTPNSFYVHNGNQTKSVGGSGATYGEAIKNISQEEPYKETPITKLNDSVSDKKTSTFYSESSTVDVQGDGRPSRINKNTSYDKIPDASNPLEKTKNPTAGYYNKILQKPDSDIQTNDNSSINRFIVGDFGEQRSTSQLIEGMSNKIEIKTPIVTNLDRSGAIIETEGTDYTTIPDASKAGESKPENGYENEVDSGSLLSNKWNINSNGGGTDFYDSLKPGANENPEPITFSIRDLVNDRFLYFRNTITGYNENINSEWQGNKYIGRPIQKYTYGGFNRTVNFNFIAYSENETQLIFMWDKINYLMNLLKPSFNDVYMIPPFCTLTIGNLYQNQPILLSNVTFAANDEFPWDLNNKIPMYADILIQADIVEEGIINQQSNSETTSPNKELSSFYNYYNYESKNII